MAELLKILPLTIVMIAGPQIISAIFVATSENWKRNSVAYVFGASLSISAVITLAFALSTRVSTKGGSSDDLLHLVVLGLLLAAMVHVYLSRKKSDPPKWMGALQTARPSFSFKLGFLLLGFFPTDILTSIAVGSHLAAQNLPLWHAVGFLVVTLLLLGLPALTVLTLGKKGEALLPKVRDWMNTNSWVVSEAVILFFVAMTLNNLLR